MTTSALFENLQALSPAKKAARIQALYDLAASRARVTLQTWTMPEKPARAIGGCG